MDSRDSAPQSNEWLDDQHRVFAEFHRELLRVCPELGDAAGVFGPSDLLTSELLGVLRQLPEGVGTQELDRALKEYRRSKG